MTNPERTQTEVKNAKRNVQCERPDAAACKALLRLQGENFNLRDEVRGLRHALRMIRRALELEEHDLAWDVAGHPAEYNRCADCDYPLHLALGRVPRCPACGERWAWAD